MGKLVFSKAEIEFLQENERLIEVAFDSTENLFRLAWALAMAEGLSDYDRRRLEILIAYCAGKEFILYGNDTDRIAVKGLEKSEIFSVNKKNIGWRTALLVYMRIPEEIVNEIEKRMTIYG